ncbi:cyclophilin-like fold protein [Nocardiopsis sp. JB363]|uniref:cyclophilin-like fold protein n=1 Tax=Nocardiopsis sp. JB363 TaxID=1434837 RepID=UPI000B357C67|nr:cyclophilin-like fold protein [Nocardiopsis sp. JB363]
MEKTTLATLTAGLLSALVLAGCSDGPDTGETATAPPNQSAEATSTPSGSASSPSSSDVRFEGTIVRLSVGAETVDVTIGEDTPATRDFVSMLPMTLTLEEFNGREKIADLPRELEWEGSPGSDPEDGDLIFFVPWGNIGFYYDADGIGYSDQTIHLGTYDATEAELARFEGQETRVEVVD